MAKFPKTFLRNWRSFEHVFTKKYKANSFTTEGTTKYTYLQWVIPLYYKGTVSS